MGDDPVAAKEKVSAWTASFHPAQRAVVFEEVERLLVPDVEDGEAAVCFPVKWSWKMTKPRRRSSMYSFRSPFACRAGSPRRDGIDEVAALPTAA